MKEIETPSVLDGVSFDGGLAVLYDVYADAWSKRGVENELDVMSCQS